MIKGIGVFIATYLLLIVLSLGLLVLCTILGIGIVGIFPNLFTLTIGLGLAALGGMIFIFLIKFIFVRSRDENPLEIEIKEEDQPELFGFIRQITSEVKTDFPKRIFLIPDVNAYVSYNSSFWSMFLTIRKNLRIGLGLVNSLNISEFKAALAHEFGHFSQRSTKLGSYVYTANKIIFDLVNNRDKWDQTLEHWANAGNIFSFFAGLTFRIVQQVRKLLAYLYTRLNVRYMALSREMEYHADLVACSVTGNNSLIQTLRKIEFTDSTYDHTLGILNELATKRKRAKNIYSLQLYMNEQLAADLKLKVANSLPIITEDDLQRHFVKSRINIKDQWASHPSREEREANINTIDLHSQESLESAWILFSDPDNWQQKLSEKLYSIGTPDSKNFEVIDKDEFIGLYNEQRDKYQLPTIFKGFYDNRMLGEFDPEEAKLEQTDRALEEIFSDYNRDFFQRFSLNHDDLQLLENLKTNLSKNDVFEFDYQKKKLSDIPQLIELVKQDINQGKKTRIELDRHAFQYLLSLALQRNESEKLIQLFKQVLELQMKVLPIQEITEKLQKLVNRLHTQFEWSDRQINELNVDITQLERNFKQELENLPYTLVMTTINEPEKLENYISNKSEFYTKSYSFNQNGFDNLSNCVFGVISALYEKRISALQDMTKFALELIPESKKVV